jgi:hypothetical protein
MLTQTVKFLVVSLVIGASHQAAALSGKLELFDFKDTPSRLALSIDA